MKFKAQTVQSSILKNLFYGLKEQISEGELQISKDDIQLISLDSTRHTCIHLILNGKQFEEFECSENFSIGLDILQLNKLFKTVQSGDILSLFVSDDSESETEQLGIQLINNNKGQVITHNISTIEVNTENYVPPNLDYPVTIDMPSSDFQSIVNALKSTGSEAVEISYKEGELVFYAKGECMTSKIIRSNSEYDSGKSNSGINVRKDDSSKSPNIIKIYISLAKIVEFIKFTNLSNLVTINLKNDDPVFLEYDVGTLGKITLGLSTRKVPDNWSDSA